VAARAIILPAFLEIDTAAVEATVISCVNPWAVTIATAPVNETDILLHTNLANIAAPEEATDMVLAIAFANTTADDDATFMVLLKLVDPPADDIG
jgi:hypothetical protein